MYPIIGMALVMAIGMALAPGASGQTGIGRFPQITKEALNEDQQRAAAEILKQSISGLGGPWNVMLRSPEMADRVAKLLDYIRFKTSLPLGLNEFAIMITALGSPVRMVGTPSVGEGGGAV
jgi:4-carboxymuconolactone decarboxylase